LDNYSPEQENFLRKNLLEISSKLRGCSLDGLSHCDKINLQAMRSVTRFLGGHPDFQIGFTQWVMGLAPFVVEHLGCPAIDAPEVLGGSLKIDTKSEAEDYVERLGKFGVMCASINEKIAFDANMAWIPPKGVLQGALSFLNGFVEPEPSEHPLVKAFTGKLEAVQTISVGEREKLVELAIGKVRQIVYPGYIDLSNQTSRLVPKARNEPGIWAQPNGELFYQDAIRQLGNSALTAEEIHQLGLSEVNRVTSEMDALLKAQSYRGGSVAERIQALSEESRFSNLDSKEGQQLIISEMKGLIEQAFGKMKEVCNLECPYGIDVQICPVEYQATSGVAFIGPTPANGEPRKFYINPLRLKLFPKFTLKTIVFHETIPGHHWQLSIPLEGDQPFLRKVTPFLGFSEGWAMYAEKLAKDLGFYEGDPFGDLGRLYGELLRSARLVVDTGLHSKRWSREDSVKYLIETVGQAEPQAAFEVDRYAVLPAMVLSYKLGMLKIEELRDTARGKLGERFDLAEFHDVVLRDGNLPLELVAKNVNDWISTKGRV
jgi:uncharacterized protein (DUF885 family)